MRKWIIVLCVVLCPMQAWAAGYAVYEWGARGNALGGAMVARDADPSSVAYNPAAITDLPGRQFQIGATAIAPSATMNVKTPGLESMDFADNIWALPTMYYTHQLSDNYWFGLGMFSRVGLGTEYEDADTWAGRYNCSYAAIKSVSINPNLAMKFSDAFSLAVGVEATYLHFGYDMTFRNPNVANTDVLHEIAADGWGYGINLGARYRPFDWLAFGLAWRSEIQMTVHGDGDFTQKGITSLGFTSTDVSGTEPVPESLTMGVMVKPMERLSLEFDAVWTKWSAYKSLIVNYDDPQPYFALIGSSAHKLESTKNWKDTWRFQFGAEYALTDSFDLRAGYVYDQSPVNNSYEDFAVPCTDRQIVTLGAGWKINDAWVVDASYGYLWMKDRKYEKRDKQPVELTREDARAHMAGLSVTYRF